jgi:hypothetical protein
LRKLTQPSLRPIWWPDTRVWGYGPKRPKPTGPLVNIPVETGPKDGLLVNVPQGIDTSVPGYESKKPIGTDGGTATLNLSLNWI